MNAQQIKAPGERKPFAIRFFITPDSKDSLPVKKGLGIALAPELGAVVYNLERFDGYAVKCWTLRKPVHVGVIRAMLRAEVWETWRGERRRQSEEWFAAKVPPGFPTLQAFILNRLGKKDRKPMPTPPPTSTAAREAATAAHNAATAAMAGLLANDYPKLATAIKGGKDKEAIRQAFIADHTRLYGHAPDVEDMRTMMQEKEFIGLLTALRSAPRQTRSQAYALASRWNHDRLYKLKEEELNTAMNTALHTTYKAGYWPRLARRMGLHRPLGRRETIPAK